MKKAILRTLAYADVFDYPLTAEELYRFLITEETLSRSSFRKALIRIKANEKRINANGEYFFLRNRGGIVALRKRREKWSEQKMEIAQRVTRWLRLIPTIKMVAITGASAIGNSDKNDDVDLLIVTSKNRLWLTRLLAVLMVELVSQRRRPGDRNVKDKICLNMFLDEARLGVPKKEQDLYSAHEVCQLKPLWDRDGIYQRFLKKNQWVKHFLPNWKPKREHLREKNTSEVKLSPNKENTSEVGLMDNLERLAMKLQLHYMAKRKTTEITEPGRIRFHPQDARKWILEEYQKRLKKLDIEDERWQKICRI